MPISNASDKPDFFIASVDTRNFDFEAFGLTDAQAREALRQTLVKHVQQYAPRIADDWVGLTMEDCSVREVWIGAGYRDRQLLIVDATCHPVDQSQPVRQEQKG